MGDLAWGIEDGEPIKALSMEPYIEIHEKQQLPTPDAPIIGDIIADLTEFFGTFAPQPARWPVERTGEREAIPWPTRLAVAKRDSYICRHCRSLGRVGDDHTCPCPNSDSGCIEHPEAAR